MEIRRGKKRLPRDSNPVLVDAIGDQVNTELLMSQSSHLNFLNIMLLSFEIGFLGVWFSRRSKSARSYLHSRCANRGSHEPTVTESETDLYKQFANTLIQY